MVYRPEVPLAADDGPPEEVVREQVTLTVDGRTIPLTSGRVVVGRSRECDIRVDDGNVSRRHFELVQEGPTAWVVADLGSTNGTEVNGRRVSGRKRLDDGDRISDRRHRARLRSQPPVSAVTVDEALLGLKVAFLVLLYLFIWLVVRSATRGLTVGAPQESILIPAAEATALRAAAGIRPRRVVVLQSPALQAGTAIELTNGARVGRGVENTIRLDADTTVSNRHATIESRADGLWVEDSGSTNGTFVNGARVTSGAASPPGRRDPDRAHRPARRGARVIVGRAAGLTDTGRRRRQNEDAFVCDPPLFAIADGMGGAQAGELASRLAAAAIEEAGAAVADGEGVVGAVRAANARIFERSLTDPAVAGMGTTATVALVDEQTGTMTLAHVGDSRAYRYRDGELEQLTTDHSLVAELVRTGRLTEAEAAVHPHRSVITRALGTEADVEVDTRTLELAAGDVVLLCSDGLSAMVRDDEIARLLESAGGDPYVAAETLVQAANAAGGDDNVTVVLFEVVEGSPRPPPPPPPRRSSTRRAWARTTSRARPSWTTSAATARGRVAAGPPSCSSSPSWRRRPSCSGGASCGERAQPRARDAPAGGHRRLDGVRERVDLRSCGHRLRLAPLGCRVRRDRPRRPRSSRGGRCPTPTRRCSRSSR